MKNDPEQPASKQQTAESAGQFSLDQRTTALLQAFVRATARHQHESVTFSEDATVAHLAMELARLRDAKEPIAFLPEAAKLLIEARNALAEERRRPLGDNLTAAELTKHTIENLKANRVPWEKICRPGKRLGSTAEQDEFEEISYEGADGEGSFRWKVYTTPDGFEELLKKHWKEHLLIEYEDAADSVRENPPAGEGADEWGAKVEALLDRRGLFYDQTCRERLRLVRNLHNFESYVEFWLERAASKVWKRFLDERQGVGWTVQPFTVFTSLAPLRRLSDQRVEPQPSSTTLPVSKGRKVQDRRSNSIFRFYCHVLRTGLVMLGTGQLPTRIKRD